jgi:RNA polymerase sigma-B factor
VEALGAGNAYRTLSLDVPAEDGAEPAELLGSADDGFERAEERAVLHHGLAALPPREREIVHLSFYEGLSQREIAARVGISQMHVSRLIRRSIETVRVRCGVPRAA